MEWRGMQCYNIGAIRKACTEQGAPAKGAIPALPFVLARGLGNKNSVSEEVTTLVPESKAAGARMHRWNQKCSKQGGRRRGEVKRSVFPKEVKTVVLNWGQICP
jgi:hypothetical protein